MSANFDHAADRVAFRARLVHTLLEIGGEHVTFDGDPDLCKQCFRHRPSRDDHGGVARARPFERVADVRQAVLEHAGKVGVSRPRQRHLLRPFPRRLALRLPRAHPRRPVLVVAIAHDERERRSQCAPLAETGEHFHLVLLDLLPRATAVALLPPVEVRVDRSLVQHEPRRQPTDDRDEGRAVRFAGG